jgi:DNA polymerase I
MSGLFELPPRATKAGDSLILNKTKTKSTKTTTKPVNGIMGLVSMIKDLVGKVFADKMHLFECVQDEEVLNQYINEIIVNGICAIDTETNGLDVMQDKVVGIGLHTPNQKSIYIPIGHVSYITGEKAKNQLSAEVVGKALNRLTEYNVKNIWHNAVFDIRMIINTLGVKLNCYWDCYVAARLLNELEEENSLSFLHSKYCKESISAKIHNYSDLFKGLKFSLIPIPTAYLYGANDPLVTFELHEFQKQYLTKGTEECTECELEGPSYVMEEIEMPLVDCLVDMEQTGIAFDFDYNKKLYEKYDKKLKEKEKVFFDFCEKNKKLIDDYRTNGENRTKLGEPININSPTQIAILLYDILGIKGVDKQKPRGTGEPILEKIDKPICKIILDYREVEKLINTYIKKMPEIVNPNTQRIHARFNQIGADTGRFSSSDPNMQNIPSENKDIRKMFKATDGYYLLSSDYSAQEPRLTAHMSKDKKMIQAYVDGKDLYVEIASIAFGLPYDKCKEFRNDGTSNPEGKKRRNSAKAIVLGICYGKGVPAIAEDLKITTKKAQEIYDKVMLNFPGLKQFMIDSEDMAIEKGFVTTVWGRKRRLPDMQLEKYEFMKISGGDNFDPFFDDSEFDLVVPDQTKGKYIRLMDKAYGKARRFEIKEQAKKEGILIKDNSMKINDATRQCVNSRIQGSAADQIKIAMINVHNNKELKDLGFRLLLTVHDELIGECPKENVKRCVELFRQEMINAGKLLSVPSRCDVEITERWYGEPLDILNF